MRRGKTSPLHEAVPRVGWTPQAIQRRVPELHGGHGGGRIELSRLFEASDARARDSAWADFVAAHSRLLLHVARSLTTDHDAAMDGYAHVLERLREHDCRRLRGYVPDGRTKFTTWLVVVARRLCLDFHRHRYGRSDDPAPDAAAARAARRRLVNLVAGETEPEQLAAPGSDPASKLQAEELHTAVDAAKSTVAVEIRKWLVSCPLRYSGAVSRCETLRVQTDMQDSDLPPILVVDDNHDNAEIIRQYLEIRGYPITVAHNGDEALGLFETVRPALVLLDVMMPGRDGWEVCRIMRQHPTLGKSVRIVMVTALGEWEDKREALQLGADDYVEKPFDLPTLATTVQRNLAMRSAMAS